jgi:serine/threonine protein kinase
LSYLHGRNVSHRDIKGANILLSEDGKAKISKYY